MRTLINIIIPFTLLLLLASCKNSNKNVQLKNDQLTFITTDGIKLPVKVSGVGSACMFVPGGPGGGYLSFEKLGGSNLEKSLTMIYMDQRGSGSAQNAKNYDLDRVLKDMEEVRVKLGVDKMYLMSHSFGGVILVNYALKYPQHVRGLILVNSALYFFSPQMLTDQMNFGYNLLGIDTIIRTTNPDSLVAGNMAIREQLSKKHLGYKLLTNHRNTLLELEQLDSLYPRTNDFAMEVLGPILDKKKPMVYPAYFRDYTPLSASIQAPTLVINGNNDRAIGPNHYKLFKFPDVKIEQFNGGHLLYYEENKLFVKVVRDFVARVDSKQ